MNIKKYIQDVLKICRLAAFSPQRVLWTTVAMTVLGFLSALMDSFGITLFFPVLLKGVSSAKNPFASVPIIGNLVDFQTISVPVVLIIIAVFFALKVLLDLTLILVRDNLSLRLRGRYQSKFTENVLKRPLIDIEQLRVGDISSRVVADTPRAATYVASGSLMLGKLVSIFGYLVILIFISPMITLVILAIGILIMFCVKKFYGQIAIVGSEMNRQRDMNNRHLVERLHQIRLIKTLGMEREEINYLDKRYEKWCRVTFHSQVLAAISRQFMNSTLFIGAGIFAVVAFFKESLITSFFFVLAPILVIAQRLVAVLNELNQAFVNIKRDEPSVEFLFRDYDMRFLDEKSAKKTKDKEPIEKIEKIDLAGVSFSYNHVPVLKNVSLELSIGRSALVQGASGSGKTTLANLLRNIIVPQEGRVLFDGRDLEEIDMESFKNHIGYVTQESFIFYGSLRENLLYGNKKELSDEDIYKVLAFCDVKDFVESLPGKLDYQVTERGSVLSGGQKQRLNFARILLKDPYFIILDEVTNNLDQDNKQKIVALIKKLLKEKILFIISHDKNMEIEGVQKYEISGGGLKKI